MTPGPLRPPEDGPGHGADPPEPGSRDPHGAGAPLLSFKDVALVGVATGLLCAVFILLVMFGMAVRMGGPGLRTGIPGWAMPVLFLVEAVAIAASVYVVLIRRRGLRWRDLGLRPTTRGWVAAGLATAVACLVAGAFLSSLLDPLFDAPMVERYAAQFGPESASLGQAVGVLVVGGFVVPVAEEILFRGVFYGWLRQTRGIAVSTVVSAAVFTLVHANPQVAVQIFLIGAALAYLYERSGSLVPAMVTHMTINVSSLAAILFYARLWG